MAIQFPGMVAILLVLLSKAGSVPTLLLNAQYVEMQSNQELKHVMMGQMMVLDAN